MSHITLYFELIDDNHGVENHVDTITDNEDSRLDFYLVKKYQENDLNNNKTTNINNIKIIRDPL